MKEEAQKGTVSDDMVYFYMAVMYANNPDELASLREAPPAAEVAKVRAMILREYGSG